WGSDADRTESLEMRLRIGFRPSKSSVKSPKSEIAQRLQELVTRLGRSLGGRCSQRHGSVEQDNWLAVTEPAGAVSNSPPNRPNQWPAICAGCRTATGSGPVLRCRNRCNED